MWSPQSELWTSLASWLYYRRWHLCFYFLLYIRRTEHKHLPSLPWRSVLKERRIGLLVVNDSGSSSHGPGTFTTDDCKKGQSCSRIWETLKSQWQKGGPSGWGRGWAAGRRRIHETARLPGTWSPIGLLFTWWSQFQITLLYFDLWCKN